MGSIASPVVASAKVLFKPNIKADEKIAATHLLDLQLRLTGAPISPRNWHTLPFIPADDSFKRYFDRQVEMGRNQRAASIYRRFAVGLERISDVIMLYSKQDLEKAVGE